MEETLSLIYHGCELARDLQLNLPNLSNQPNALSNCCDEIARLFKGAADRLNDNQSFSFHPLPKLELSHQDQSVKQQPKELDNTAVQEWLTSSYTQAMEHEHAQSSSENMINKNPFNRMGASSFSFFGFGGMVSAENVAALTGGGAESFEQNPKHGTEYHMVEGSSGSVTQRSRKRKDGQEQRTVRVGTPQLGNPEIPPDDGFTWRKYGQKEILGSLFPRGYYRCTHKTFYGCDAKKQVQRLDDDPRTFEVTYYGHHTCHISQTAPAALASVAPPSTSTIGHQENHPDTASQLASLPLYRWLSMDMGGGRVAGQEGTVPQTELQLEMYTDFNQLGRSGNITSTVAAGPSNSQTSKESPDFPVVDLADTMFNSGGSSNSMDSIFPSSMQDNL